MQTSEPTQTAPVAGATMIAEAATAEAALAEVHATYGADARIVAAKRVLRGGVGGFFAKEVVQIHAAAGEPSGPAETPALADAPSAAPVVPVAEPRQSPAHRVTPPRVTGRDEAPTGNPIDRLLAEADQQPEEIDFATFLRRQFDPGAPTTPSTTSSPAPQDGAESQDGPATMAAQPEAAPEPPASGPAAASDIAARARAAASEVIANAASRSAVSWADLGSYERPAWADAPAGSTVTDLEAPVADLESGMTARAPWRAAPDATVPPAADEPAPEGRAWSRTALVRLGLPAAFVQSLAIDDPTDDAAWTFALVEALRPLCRPLPAGRALVVGPRARSLAGAVGLPVAAVGKPLFALGDVAAAVTGSDASLDWMERARRGRWVHLVIGGKGWRELLHVDPLAVSWAGEDDLPESVRVALDLGLVLGYGPSGRARPLDLALAIRDLVPRS